MANQPTFTKVIDPKKFNKGAKTTQSINQKMGSVPASVTDDDTRTKADSATSPHTTRLGWAKKYAGRVDE